MANRDVLDFRNITLSGRHTSSLIQGGKPSSLGISSQERYTLDKGHNSIHLASFPQEYKLPPLRSRGTVISTNLGQRYPSPSDTDETSSSNAFLSQEEVKSECQSLVNPKQNALYRYEMDGIVVYDMNSKTMEMIQKEPPPFIPLEQVKKKQPTSDDGSDEEKKSSQGSDVDEADEVKSIESFEEQPPQKKDFPDQKDRLVYGALPEYPKKRAHIIQYTLGVPEEANIIQFDSRFENGNLAKAVKIGPHEYNLLLSNDFNTKGHTQWFYFKVISKLEKGSSIKLNIVNLTKPDSLYSYGMKPCVLSETKRMMTGEGWHRDCFNIAYFQNKIERVVRRADLKETPQWAKYFYTISFSYTFKYDCDSVYFAHSFPYTYSRLQEFINQIARDRRNKKYLRVNTLCNSLASRLCWFKLENKCYLLTITEDVDSYMTYEDERRLFEKSHAARKLLRLKAERAVKENKMKDQQRKKKKKQSPRLSQDVMDDEEKEPLEQVMIRMAKHAEKKGVVLSGRVHPGEPQASWVLQGTIQYLLSNEEDARILRRNFVFKILPMLNPDGVIYGNYRCSLLGVDLNRKWLTPNKYLHPTIYYAKQLVRNFTEERQVKLFCDYHGHSRKMNTFTYGCTFSNSEFDGFKKNSMLRLFSLLLSQINPTFSFKDCHFRLERCKESTARIVLFREFEIMNSFTLEASFFGADSHGINCEDPILKKSNEIEKAKQERELQKKNEKLKKKNKSNKSGANSPRRNQPQEQSNKSSPRKLQLVENKEEESVGEPKQAKLEEQTEEVQEQQETEQTDDDEHLKVQDYFRVGHDVCRTLIQFLPIRNYRRKLYLCVQRIAQVLHEEYINCPFQLSMFTREKPGRKGAQGEEKRSSKESGKKGVLASAQSLDIFSEGEGEESVQEIKSENVAAMAGITELLIARKAKAIEERKNGKGDDASDTTSSDSEESVKERMFKKAKENKKKKQKFKEMMNRKKLKLQRKPMTKDTVGIGAELRRAKAEANKKVAENQKSPLPPSPVDRPKKKKIVQKIPSPSTLYLKRQHTDFLARLTKATREEQAIREVLPNLDMLPVVIDSKPIHSLYIKNRTKSQHAGAIQEDLECFVDLDAKQCESPPIIREERETPRNEENIQNSLKISRINITQKPTLPPAILPAPLAPIKLSNASPKRNFKRHQGVGGGQKKGPLMIVGSGNKAEMHNFHRTSRVKLSQALEVADERRASSSYRNARLPKKESLTISPRKESGIRAPRKKTQNGLIMVKDELAQFQRSSALLLEDNFSPTDSVEHNQHFLMTHHGQFSDRATLHIAERRKKQGLETRSPSPDKARLHNKSFAKIKKKASLKRLYNPRPTLRAALGVEDPISPKLSTQQRLELQIRKHEQELLQFLNYNSSFASKPRPEQKREERQRFPYPRISSPSIHVEEQPKKLIQVQSPNSSETNFTQLKEKQALKMSAFKSTTSSIEVYKPLLTPVINKSVNVQSKEEAQRLALFFPSPSYIRALNPSERSEKKSQHFLSKIPSNMGSYEQSYYKAMEEYQGGGKKSSKAVSQKLNQTSDNWRKKKQLGMHDKSVQREQASLF